MPPASAARPWMIQLMPTIRPISATVRFRWRSSTTPSTMSSSPEIPSHTRCDSALPNNLTTWKSPETIMSTPIRTAMTFSEPLGWKLTISPSIKVTMPTPSIVCHAPITSGPGRPDPDSSVSM